MTIASWALALQLIGLVSLVVLVDSLPWLRSARLRPDWRRHPLREDFNVLVPIYGSVRYLENVGFLAAYGDRVILCTTTVESAEFDRELEGIAARHGFQICRTPVPNRTLSGQRATSGTIRDRVIRGALNTVVTQTYVVCIDADTVTRRPLAELAGAIEACKYDIVSVRLEVSNPEESWLTRIQAGEYVVAMRLRLLFPWMVSGACHAGRAYALRDVMNHHSLFFQGNDVELGVIARLRNYRVGHIPFVVPTAVPSTPRAWLRQRLAWAGGEVRLFVANPQLAWRFPSLWLYGLFVLITTPLRWLALIQHPWLTLGVLVLLYAVLAATISAGHRRLALVQPFYGLIYSLFLVPLGLIWYVKMSAADSNWGLIRARKCRARGRRVAAPRATA